MRVCCINHKTTTLQYKYCFQENKMNETGSKRMRVVLLNTEITILLQWP